MTSGSQQAEAALAADTNGSNSVSEKFDEGIRYLATDEVQPALACFEAVLGENPDHAMANYQVGLIGLRLLKQELSNRFLARAVDSFREQSRLSPLDSAAWLAQVQCLALLGRAKEAREVATTATKALPDDRGVDLAIAKFLIQISIHDVAVPLLQRCVAAGTNDATVYSELGKALAAISRREEAIAAFERAIELAPHDSDFYLDLGQMYQGNNLTASQAVTEYRRGIAAAPSDKLYVNCASALRTCGRFEEAADVLREAFEFCPPDAHDAVVQIGYLLGQILRLSGQEEEAAVAWNTALEACKILREWSDNAVRFVGQELRLLWALGRRDEGLALFETLRDGKIPDTYFYDLGNHLPDTPKRLARLQELIRGRDVCLLMHGPSVEDLDRRIADLADSDVCFMTAHGFALFERNMLKKIGREVEVATVTNDMTMSKHYDQVQEFLARPTRNVLLSSRYCFDQCGQEELNPRATERQFDEKLLFFPPPATVLPSSHLSPLSYPLCNTLSCMLPFLVLGAAKRVFLFGCDGTSREAVDGHYRYGTGEADYRYEPESEDEQRMLAINLLVDTLSFDEVADISLAGASALFDLPVPPIYNVAPQSHLKLFPKISIDDCIDMIATPAP